jgi:polyketide biosynthesis acyl carrier protein
MTVTPEISLRELGANSIDRADILMQTMSDLNVKLSMVEFASAKNIGDIASIFQKAL